MCENSICVDVVHCCSTPALKNIILQKASSYQD